MKVDSNYYHKDDLMWKWETKNRRIIHYISLLASFIAAAFTSRCSIQPSGIVYKVGTEKPAYFYIVLLVLGVIAIGCDTILNGRIEYIHAMSINNEDYGRFIKALKTTYVDKVVLFFIYLIAYAIVGFTMMYLHFIVERAVM